MLCRLGKLMSGVRVCAPYTGGFGEGDLLPAVGLHDVHVCAETAVVSTATPAANAARHILDDTMVTLNWFEIRNQCK